MYFCNMVMDEYTNVLLSSHADCTFEYTLLLKVNNPEYDVHSVGKIARQKKNLFQFWINQHVNKIFHLFIEAYIYSTVTKDCFLV